jgi:S1-C subfamily serine protease
VEFAGKPVKDLYGYTDALYAQKPGDVVDVVVLRGTERITLKVTLGRRGS